MASQRLQSQLEREIFQGSSQSDNQAAASSQATQLPAMDTKPGDIIMSKWYPSLKPFSTAPGSGLSHLSSCLLKVNSPNFEAPLEGQATPLSISETVTKALAETIQLTSRATGACIYAIAMYPDGEDGCEIYECASDRILHVLSTTLSNDIRDNFIRSVNAIIGPTLSRDPSHVYPTIYGIAEHNFRPRVPPRQTNMMQECYVYSLYLPALADWQRIDFSWKDLQDDYALKKYQIVSPNRIPRGVKAIGHPLTIDFRDVALMLAYIRWGQDILDSGNRDLLKHVFQFTQPGRQYEFQDMPDPDSTLVYDEDSAFYYLADQKHHFGPNAYLPTPPPEPLFTVEGERLLGCLADPLNAEIRDVKSVMNMLHTAEIEEFQISDTDHPLHRRYRYSASNIVSYMNQPMLCREVYDWMDDQHRFYEFGTYVQWIKNGALLNPETGMIRGGYGGLFAAFFNGLRLEWTKRAIASSEQLSNNPHILKFDGTDMKNMVTELFIYLRDKSRETVRKTVSRPKVSLPPGSRLTSYRPDSIRYRKANKESGILEPKDYEPSNEDRERLGLTPEGGVWQHNSLELAPLFDFSKDELEPRGYSSQTANLLVPPTGTFVLNPPKTSDPRRRPATIAVPPVPLPPVPDDVPTAGTSRRSSSEEPRSVTNEGKGTFSTALQIDLISPPIMPPSPDEWMASTDQFSPSALEQEAEMSTPNPSRGRLGLRHITSQGHSEETRGKSVSTPEAHSPPALPTATTCAASEANTMQTDAPDTQDASAAMELDQEPVVPEKTGPKTRSASAARTTQTVPRPKTPTGRQKSVGSSRAPSASARSAGSGSQAKSLRALSREPAVVASSAAEMDQGNVSDYLAKLVRIKSSAPEMESAAPATGASVVARHVPMKKRPASPDVHVGDAKKRGSVSR